MLKRILTAIIGLLVFFGVIFAHRFVLYGAVTLVILGMLYEIYKMMELPKNLKVLGFLTGFVMCGLFIIGAEFFAVFAGIIMLLLGMIYLHGKVDFKDVAAAAFLTVFVTLFMLAIILIRKKCDKYTVILPFICAWLTDTGAYFVGSFLGKHKLVPDISPKKTVEGAIGGVILSTLGSAAYIAIMVAIMAGGRVRTDIALKFAAIGFIGSLLAQAGDLIASCIKRDCGKKDYGSILPGHGGIMDRFDSVVFVSPFVFYAMTYFLL